MRYRKWCDMSNTDALSRIPLKETILTSVPIPGEILRLVILLESSPTYAGNIRNWTRLDPVLSKILTVVQSGRPYRGVGEESVQPYFRHKDEITVHDGCLIWGQCVIIPEPGRQRILEELHDIHSGVCRMKALAWNYVWWLGIDKDIESCVQSCSLCQVNHKMPAAPPLHPWEFPQKPWSRIHLDYAGPCEGKTLLTIVNAYSKWLDVHPMNTSTSKAMIGKLLYFFAEHGLPDQCIGS